MKRTPTPTPFNQIPPTLLSFLLCTGPFGGKTHTTTHTFRVSQPFKPSLTYVPNVKCFSVSGYLCVCVCVCVSYFSPFKCFFTICSPSDQVQRGREEGSGSILLLSAAGHGRAPVCQGAHGSAESGGSTGIDSSTDTAPEHSFKAVSVTGD